jgi:hypothetical protein
VTETTRRTASKVTGLLGVSCLVLFWIALLASPQRVDALLRPYGLYASFAVLLSAIFLPAIAAIMGSKRWLFVTALGIITLVKFFLGVTS